MNNPAANDSPLTPLRFLQRSAEVYPAKEAIVYGARRYTYAEFADTAQRFARALKARIEPGDRVVFLTPNVPEMLIAHFAVPLAGGVLVALNSRLAKAEIDYILNHSEARLLFVDEELMATVGNAFESAPALTGVIEIADPNSVSRPAVSTSDSCPLPNSSPGRTTARIRCPGPSTTSAPSSPSTTPRAPPASPRASCTPTGARI